MYSAPIQALKARQNLGELLELTYYHNQQFQIARKNKVMARLVGENFMAAVDELIATDPALADTLAIMLNPEIRSAIDQSRKEYEAGAAIPIEEVLQEYAE